MDEDVVVVAQGTWGEVKCMQWENLQEGGNLEDFRVEAKAV